MKKAINIFVILLLTCLMGCNLPSSQVSNETQKEPTALGSEQVMVNENKEQVNEKAELYAKAVELEVNEQYREAANTFEQIRDYLDAKEHLERCNEFATAIELYQSAKEELDEKNDVLETITNQANELVLSKEKALDEGLRDALKEAVSKAKDGKVTYLEMPDTIDQITETAEAFKSVDYSEQIENIETVKAKLENSMKQYALVNAPSEEYVIACVKRVPGVIEVVAATEDNDPNGSLNKAGSYIAAVYFSHENVDPNTLYGDSVLENGTDGGGQIEVYRTEADANRRNDYLASFDGMGFMSSGSHTVVGTLVVRTSDELKASQQKELEASLIAELTKITE